MYIKRKLLVLSSILFSFIVFECDDVNRNDCAFALCTEEFRSIVVSMKHESDSSAFMLTDYKVIRVSDGKDLTITDDSLADNNGYYPVANDLKLDIYKFNNVEVEFKGYLNNALIFQDSFIITANCCHISLVEGKTILYL
jgi:hypothetical protein